MVEVSKTDVYTIGKIVLDYFKKNKTYPKSVKVKGVDYTIQQSTLLMSLVVATNKGTVSVIRVGGASSPNGDRCNREVNKTTYQDMCKRLNQYITQNGKLPNYVTIDGKQKCSIILFMLQLSKIISYMKDNGSYPSKILINSNDLIKPQPKPQKSRSEKILDEFEKYFGTCKYIDDALSKIQGRGYKFYFSDGYNMSETIKRVYNRQGANCYDIAEVLYHLALGMNTKYGRNYQVQYLDVWCPVSGYDHIRIRLKNGSQGEWFYRDGACVLNGGDVTSNWCGTSDNILEVNPSWIMDGQ